MNEPREKELKYVLASEDDHRRILGAGLGVARPPLRQVSHYFDGPSLVLRAAGAMLRLRETGAPTVELTFKQGAVSHDIAGYFDSVEIEAAVDAALLPRVLEEPNRLWEVRAGVVGEVERRFGRLDLVLIGRLVNERVRIDGPFRLELDRLEFPGGAFGWELEIETAAPLDAREWLEAEFVRLGVRALPGMRTKLQRMLERS